MRRKNNVTFTNEDYFSDNDYSRNDRDSLVPQMTHTMMARTFQAYNSAKEVLNILIYGYPTTIFRLQKADPRTSWDHRSDPNLETDPIHQKTYIFPRFAHRRNPTFSPNFERSLTRIQGRRAFSRTTRRPPKITPKFQGR